MILVVEPIFANAHHAPVNAGLLEAILLAAQGEPVMFAAHPAHRAAVQDVLGDVGQKNFTSTDLEVLPAGGISVRRFMSQSRSLLRLTRQMNARLVVVLGTTPETLFACRTLAMIRRDIRIIAVLHGNLDEATRRRSRDPRRRWFDDRASLAAATHPAIRFVMLEQSIARSAIAQGLVPADRCLVWPHPINEREAFTATHVPDPRRIRIAFPGLGKHAKGFADFARMARRIGSVSERHAFSLIGGLYGEFPPEDLAHVEIPGGFLERGEFLRRLHEADYVCLPLRDDTYTLTASGAMIDSIAALKPFIALPTPSVRDLFSNGPVGYLCKDLTEMEDVLRDTDRLCDPTTYAGFMANIERERARRLPPALTTAVGEALR